MKLTKEEFNQLQKEWYERLKQGGFKDIEPILFQPSVSRPDRHIYKLKKNTQEYYQILGKMVSDENTIFKNAAHQYILTRYSEGALIKTIVEELKDRGMPRHRHNVRMIIRRYETAWKIRVYQLQK